MKESPATGIRGHIPALDGVRGIAIILVIVYHAARGLRWGGPFEGFIERSVNAGWIGVDLFFVLSGFLITGVLLDAKGGESYFGRFYARRALRIVPLYFAVVLLVVGIVPATRLATAAQAAQLRNAQVWYWTYTMNLLIARWEWPSAAWHTGHLWSLSVEEQFYMVWPLLVFLLSRRVLIRTTAALVIGVSLLRVVLVSMHASPTALYVLLPTRMDGLALGALLATLARQAEGWKPVERLAAPVMIAATAMLVLIFHQESLLASGTLTETLGYPSLALLSGATIVSAVGAPPSSAIGRLWNLPALRFFGRYSYGLYAWHPFTIALFREYVLPADALPVVRGSHIPGNLLFTVIAFALSIGVALISWRAIEQPFLALKRFVPNAAPVLEIPAPVGLDEEVA